MPVNSGFFVPEMLASVAGVILIDWMVPILPAMIAEVIVAAIAEVLIRKNPVSPRFSPNPFCTIFVILVTLCFNWSGRKDLNLLPLVPQTINCL